MFIDGVCVNGVIGGDVDFLNLIIDNVECIEVLCGL